MTRVWIVVAVFSAVYVSIIQEIAREQRPSVADECDEWPGDDHHGVVIGRHEQDGGSGCDDGYDPCGLEFGLELLVFSLIAAIGRAICVDCAKTSGGSGRDAHDPEQDVGGLCQRQWVCCRTPGGVNGEDKNNSRYRDRDNQAESGTRLIPRLWARRRRSQVRTNRRRVRTAGIERLLAGVQLGVAQLRGRLQILPATEAEAGPHELSPCMSGQ